MGSPIFAVPSLEKLIRDIYNIVAVYTQPDRPAGRGRKKTPPPVKQVAEKYGIPVIQPESLKPEPVLDEMRSWRPDVIIICAYGQILTQEVIDMPPEKCLNIHFSLLPRHRGASPVAAAILAGDEFTGVSVQIVRYKLDTGPLLASAAIPVMEDDTTLSLALKLSHVGAGMISETLGGWLRHERIPEEQDETKATYIPQIKKDQGIIEWKKPAVELWREIRAYYPWPGSYTTWKQRMIKITKAEVVEDEGSDKASLNEAGTVIKIGHGFGVRTGNGILRINKLQPEGKKEMNAEEFLRGHRDIIGHVLPD